MKRPEISVVIPCYKEGKLLEETIESVLKQTFPDFEILLVDNNSSFETKAVIDSYVKLYPQTIRSIKEPVQGLSVTRNKGIMESQGSFIALLDGDDLMYPTRLERQYDAIQKKPSVALVACGVDWFITGDSPEKKTILQENALGGMGHDWRERTKYLRKLFTKFPKRGDPQSFFYTLPSTMFFPKDKALNAGLFSLQITFFDEDIEFLTRMIDEGSFLMIPEPLVAYRNQSPSSGSHQFVRSLSDMNLKRHIADDKYLSILFGRYREKMHEAKPIFRLIYAQYLRVAGREFMQYFHGVSIGRILLLRAFLMDPGNISGWKLLMKSILPKKFFPTFFWFKHFSMVPIPSNLNRDFPYAIFSFPSNQSIEGKNELSDKSSSTLSSVIFSEKSTKETHHISGES